MKLLGIEPVFLDESTELLFLDDRLCKRAGERMLLSILGGLVDLSDLGSKDIFDFVGFDSAMCYYVVRVAMAVEVDLG